MSFLQFIDVTGKNLLLFLQRLLQPFALFLLFLLQQFEIFNRLDESLMQDVRVKLIGTDFVVRPPSQSLYKLRNVEGILGNRK